MNEVRNAMKIKINFLKVWGNFEAFGSNQLKCSVTDVYKV